MNKHTVAVSVNDAAENSAEFDDLARAKRWARSEAASWLRKKDTYRVFIDIWEDKGDGLADPIHNITVEVDL